MCCQVGGGEGAARSTEPDAGATSPPTAVINDDLPAPLGPTSATTSPERRSRSASRTATVARTFAPRRLPECSTVTFLADTTRPPQLDDTRRSFGNGGQLDGEGLRLGQSRYPDALGAEVVAVFGEDRGGRAVGDDRTRAVEHHETVDVLDPARQPVLDHDEGQAAPVAYVGHHLAHGAGVAGIQHGGGLVEQAAHEVA